MCYQPFEPFEGSPEDPVELGSMKNIKNILLLGIVATTIALTSNTARAGDVGVRVQIGLPFPPILLPPPPPFVVVRPVVHYPAPRPVPYAPPVVYHRCDYRCNHGAVRHEWSHNYGRHHHMRGHGCWSH